MQIEQAIRDLTTAIDNLSAALKSANPRPVDPAPAAKEEDKVMYQLTEIPPPPGPSRTLSAEAPVTEADLRVAAQKLLHAKRLPDILRINKEFGIRRITECPPDRYAALYDALNAALADASGS